MRITFDKLNAQIDWRQGEIPEVSGDDASVVNRALRFSYGMFGHIARIDQPLPDYDLWSAVQKELREYGPQVDEEPTVPPIPDDAVS